MDIKLKKCLFLVLFLTTLSFSSYTLADNTIQNSLKNAAKGKLTTNPVQSAPANVPQPPPKKTSSTLAAASLQSIPKKYVEGELLVKFKSGTFAPVATSLHSALGSVKIKDLTSIKVQHVKLKEGVSVEEAVNAYNNAPEVEYAEPNYIYHALSTTPNDTSFGNLWGLNNTGQTVNGIAGTPDADMDMPEAWDITTGSSSVVIAVIDSGVAYDHPDLSSNIWSNSDEIVNGVDSDGNGKVDDIRGWDFVDDDNDPMDTNMVDHGTHVAGTIGAKGNNGSGITGVAWNVKIMPIRIASDNGITLPNIISGIDYAVTNGAKIINLSLGGTSYSLTMRDAISTANNAGVLVVAAAGNGDIDGVGDDNDSTPYYPASYDLANIISVAATDQNDSLTSFSNYGATSVDVAAPGDNIYSTQPPNNFALYEGFEGYVPWTVASSSGYSWSVDSTLAYSGSKSLADSSSGYNYLNNTDTWVTSPSLDLSGKSQCIALTMLNGTLETGYDYLYIQASTDGVNFYTLSTGYYSIFGWLFSTTGAITGTTYGLWLPFVFDLSSYDNQSSVYIRFRLISDSIYTYAGANVDDGWIYCSSSTYDGSEYKYMPGTSMAAPHVAGLAGLLLAQNPNLTVIELKNLILNNVDTIPGLSGKMVSGGRVNAYSSLVQGDITSPTSASININSGSSYTNSTSTTLSLSASDNIGITGYYVSEMSTTPSAGSFTSVTSTTSYSADISFTLSSSDAVKRVYAWFKDAAGNISSSSNDTITYDATSPTGSITAPSDNSYVVSATPPTFTASASDTTSGVASVKFQYKPSSAGNYTDINTDTSSPYQANWGSTTLTGGVTYNLRIVVTDNTGNTYTSSIISLLPDTTVPSAPGTPTDAGTDSTSTTVTFNWTAATDSETGIASYNLQVGTTVGGNDIYNANVGNVLTKSVTGTIGQILYARVQAVNGAGIAGSWSGNSDGITIDDTAPVSESININEGTHTNSQSISVSLSASDNTGVVGYYLSEISTTPSASSPGWQTITSTTNYSATNESFTLSNGDGVKIVYVWFKDAIGNISSSSNDTIIYDTVAPSNDSIDFINGGGTTTDSIGLTLTLLASDDTGVTGYYVSEASTAPTISSSGWIAVTSDTTYSADVSFVMGTEQGQKFIYVWFKDAAGNISNVAFDTITSTYIPTLSEWGIIIFTILILLSGIGMLRKRVLWR